MFFAPTNAYPELSEKPIAAVRRLSEELIAHATKKSLPAESIISSWDEHSGNYLHILPDGYCSLYRRRDQLLLCAGNPPVLVGLTELFSAYDHYYVKTNIACTCYTLHCRDAYRLITEKNLWREVAEILSYYIAMLACRDERLTGVSSYDAIKSSLTEYQQLSEIIKKTITVAQFIQRKTGLSRSLISQTLSELRKGEFIIMEKGKLLEVRALPKRF